MNSEAILGHGKVRAERKIRTVQYFTKVLVRTKGSETCLKYDRLQKQQIPCRKFMERKSAIIAIQQAISFTKI